MTIDHRGTRICEFQECKHYYYRPIPDSLPDYWQSAGCKKGYQTELRSTQRWGSFCEDFELSETCNLVRIRCTLCGTEFRESYKDFFRVKSNPKAWCHNCNKYHNCFKVICHISAPLPPRPPLSKVAKKKLIVISAICCLIITFLVFDRIKQAKRDDQAVQLNNQLSLSIKTFGQNHSNVALSYNNLAEHYLNHFQFKEAEDCYNRSLRILKKSSDPTHPDVATVLENMSLLYKKMGQIQKADDFKEQAKMLKGAN